MRAWQNTCLPCSSAATVISRCMYGCVPIQTASTSFDSTTSRQSRAVRSIPNSCAARSDDSVLLFATTLNSTPGTARRPGACCVRTMPPAPMNPILIGWLAISTPPVTIDRHDVRANGGYSTRAGPGAQPYRPGAGRTIRALYGGDTAPVQGDESAGLCYDRRHYPTAAKAWYRRRAAWRPTRRG